MLARQGGAAAVIGTTDLQFVNAGGSFMHRFFDQALGPGTPSIGEALAGAITAVHSQSTLDFNRLTTQGTVLFGDPALPLDPPAGSVASRRQYPVRVQPDAATGNAAVAMGAGVLTAMAASPPLQGSGSITIHDRRACFSAAPLSGGFRQRKSLPSKATTRVSSSASR